ncbi:MAG TPA: hypothetical protein VMS18_18395 [Candidatus Binatia bacterium]|nr:hypothetical protein [Candidatus Binatia bacterium]
MKRIKIIVGLLLCALLVSTGWQVAACEYANYELKDDLKDVASLGAARIGLGAQQSDEQLRAAVMRKAAAHDIMLEPEEITITRSGTGETQTVFLAADYRTRVWVPGFRLVIHFMASST